MSRKITSRIYALSILIFRSEKFAIHLLAFILFPGTVVHELSHFIIATLTAVPTGELSVLPKIDNESGEIKAGKLMLGKVDPFRHTLIGLAPIIIGLILIYLLGTFFIPFTPGESWLPLPLSLPPQGWFTQFQIGSPLGDFKLQISLFVICYMLNVISVTMFSSRKDLESMLIAGPLAILIFGSLYKIGVRVILDDPLVGNIIRITGNLNLYLLMASIVDYVVLLLLTGLSFFFQKILKRRIM